MLQGGNEEAEREERENGKGGEGLKDLEKGEVNIHKESVQTYPPKEFHMSRVQRLSATNPLRLVIDNATRVASPSPAQTQPQPHPRSVPPPLQQQQPPSPPPPQSQPRSIPTPQVNSLKNLKSLCFSCGFLEFDWKYVVGFVNFLFSSNLW